jgi:hypothetical protein
MYMLKLKFSSFPSAIDEEDTIVTPLIADGAQRN